ncbi:DNA-3-methyladenine glycosylase II [Ranunculus cassubicifolius]
MGEEGQQTGRETGNETQNPLPQSNSTSDPLPTPKGDLPHPLPPTLLSSTSKIPCRPKKTRKLNPDNSITQPSQVKVSVPRIIARTLSAPGEIAKAVRHLRSSDPQLAPIIDIHQPPTFDSFHPPFLALTKSILYQQLAFKAGTSIYTRFVSLCGGETGVLPEAVLALSTHQLRQIGVSARKASYLHDLANKYRNGILSDSSVVAMDDKSLFTMLTMVKGIGSWSVHMFMIFSLHRPDVLPIGDLGVRKGVQLLYGLEQLPRPSQMDQICEKWRPYRSVASWYMWRFAEAKGAPVIPGAAEVSGSQHLHQPQPVSQSQLLDQINSISNLG